MMGTKPTRIHWSRRVSRDKIRRLYESDAQGMLDRDLLDDVGYGIYVRCQDLLEVAEAGRGRVKCRNCGHIIVRQGVDAGSVGDEREVLRCDRCRWQVTWGDYHKSLLGKSLMIGGVEHLFESFVQQWPSARSPHPKLLLIDTLIHEFHVVQFGLGRPVGVNVIQGTEAQVAELINGLAYGPGSAPDLKETRRLWSSRLHARERRFTVSELRAIARELGVKGRSRMRKGELITAIERVAPTRLV